MSLFPTARELMEPWMIANFVLSIVLSLVIVYQTFRGYRRHGSRPMLFLALGVVLITIVPTVVSLVAAQYVSAVVFGSTIAPLSQSIRVVGLTSIVYSLYVRR
ncbi:hypothetical protein [Haladaptatus sp. CMAA 1909]|uniref:DUF7521 family protein n=1 Tax=Haladaptatus sp. CMAA 1909 TaxID=3368986 RepID=UPI0037549DED